MPARETKVNPHLDVGPYAADLDEYLTFLAVERNLSRATVESYGLDLRDYLTFLHTSGVDDYESIERGNITDYTDDLRKREYAPSAVERHIAAVK